MNQTAAANHLGQYLAWTLAVALLFALAAVVLAPLIGLDIQGSGNPGRVTWPMLFAGVFLCGFLSWWLLMPGWRRLSLLGGAAAGILAAFFSYPLVILLAEIAQSDWTGRESAGPIRFDRVFWVTGLTLMTTGFAATLSLGTVGLVTAWLLAALHPTRISRPPGDPRWSSPFWRGMRWWAAATALVVTAILTASFAYLSLTPIPVGDLAERASPTVPARSYGEALAAFETVRQAEADLALHERCPTQLLTHGRKTEVAVIFFHGLTSCPAQGEDLARSIFSDLGYNVYLPRMYGHGEADPDTLSLADLTAESLVDLANESVDLTQGLGDEVVVVGLSAGGTIAAWTAQYRPDVARAIPVSPFLGAYVVPPWATHAAINLVLMLPNMMFWANPLAPVTAPETDYVFPHPSTHTLAQVMRLGHVVMTAANTEPPVVPGIALLLNEADVAVNNDLAEQLIVLWRGHGHPVSVHSLPFSRHLPHDLINPHEIFGDTELVYSLLATMVQGETP